MADNGAGLKQKRYVFWQQTEESHLVTIYVVQTFTGTAQHTSWSTHHDTKSVTGTVKAACLVLICKLTDGNKPEFTAEWQPGKHIHLPSWVGNKGFGHG